MQRSSLAVSGAKNLKSLTYDNRHLSLARRDRVASCLKKKMKMRPAGFGKKTSCVPSSLTRAAAARLEPPPTIDVEGIT
jgi:hypothetical protein